MRRRLDRPPFNHTRADGPFDPCPICLRLMTRAQLIEYASDLEMQRRDLLEERAETAKGEAEDPLTPSERGTLSSEEAKGLCLAMKSGTGGGIQCELPLHHAGDHNDGRWSWPAEQRRERPMVPDLPNVHIGGDEPRLVYVREAELAALRKVAEAAEAMVAAVAVPQNADDEFEVMAKAVAEWRCSAKAKEGA